MNATVIVSDEDVRELREHVAGLWPAHRLPTLKARSLLHWLRKPANTVCAVLSSLFDDDPDATYPTWRAVRTRLYQAGAGRVVRFDPKGDGFDGDRSWWSQASAAGNDGGAAQELLGTPSETDGKDCQDWMLATLEIHAYQLYRLGGAGLEAGLVWPENRTSDKWIGRREQLLRCWQLANICRVCGPNTTRIKDKWLAGLTAEVRRGQINGIMGDPVSAAEAPF